jgi:hypothetical protein
VSPTGFDGKEHYNPDQDFSADNIHIADDATWRAATAGQPLASSARRRQLARMMNAKLCHADPEVQVEGLHGLWELCIQHNHHIDVLTEGVPATSPSGATTKCIHGHSATCTAARNSITFEDRLSHWAPGGGLLCLCLLDLNSAITVHFCICLLPRVARQHASDTQLHAHLLISLPDCADIVKRVVQQCNQDGEGTRAHLAAAVLWAVGPTGRARSMALAANAVTALHQLLKRTLSQPESAERNLTQAFALGALGVYLVCVRCRGQLLSAEPDLGTLLAASEQLPGYADDTQAARREAAAKVFASIIQRDSYVRQTVVEQVHTLLS